MSGSRKEINRKQYFTTHIKVYKPTVMYFRLTNSFATFQTMMNNLFQDIINQETTVYYCGNRDRGEI